MSLRIICLFLIVVMPLGCNVPLRVGEVSRIASPSGGIDAIVIEASTGARSSSSYDVFLVPSQKEHINGVHVASLYAATRNAKAYGVNLRWEGQGELFIEYLKADAAEILNEQVTIEGQQVRVKLRGGIEDPNAPPGGMLNNLRYRRKDSNRVE